MNPLHVCIADEHWYPASIGGMASGRVFDCLAKGLAELGHRVSYLISGCLVPLPPGVAMVCEVPAHADIIHVAEPSLIEKLGLEDRLWIRTRHVDSTLRGIPRTILPNTIYVSRTLAAMYGSENFVWNGIDPGEFFYSEDKQDYVLFLCGLDRAIDKGWELALAAARQTGVRLVLGGSSADPRVTARFTRICAENRIEYAGEVWGARRAALLAHARALLFPTQWNESFGLVIAEALMSGTPVISSNRGACPELISPDVGFLCDSIDAYADAIRRACEISPAACRAKAMRDFHYRSMATAYVARYRQFLANYTSDR